MNNAKEYTEPNLDDIKKPFIEYPKEKQAIENIPSSVLKDLETCDCGRSDIHDCVCPQCRIRFLEAENERLEYEVTRLTYIKDKIILQKRRLTAYLEMQIERSTRFMEELFND